MHHGDVPRDGGISLRGKAYGMSLQPTKRRNAVSRCWGLCLPLSWRWGAVSSVHSRLPKLFPPGTELCQERVTMLRTLLPVQTAKVCLGSFRTIKTCPSPKLTASTSKIPLSLNCFSDTLRQVCNALWLFSCHTWPLSSDLFSPFTSWLCYPQSSMWPSSELSTGTQGLSCIQWHTGKDNSCIFLRPIGSQQLLRVGYGPRTLPVHAWLVTGLGVCRSSAGWAGAMKKAWGCPSPQLLAFAVFSPTPLFNDFLLLNKTQGNTIKGNFSFLNLFYMID